MLHGVEVDVIQMGLEVVLIGDGVLPEPPLPDARLAMPPSRRADILRRASADHRSREFDLHPPDPSGVIGVAGREGPEEVDMVGQDHRRDDLERTLRPDPPQRPAQGVHSGGVGENPAS